MSNSPEFVQEAVLNALRNPDTTVEQLRAVMTSEVGAQLQSMTMAEFLGSSDAPASAAPKNKGSKSSAASVSTRTQADREAYDASILAFVKKSKEPVSSTAIRAACGGSPLQARTALNRLIEEEKLSWEGKARATKYFAA